MEHLLHDRLVSRSSDRVVVAADAPASFEFPAITGARDMDGSQDEPGPIDVLVIGYPAGTPMTREAVPMFFHRGQRHHSRTRCPRPAVHARSCRRADIKEELTLRRCSRRTTPTRRHLASAPAAPDVKPARTTTTPKIHLGRDSLWGHHSQRTSPVLGVAGTSGDVRSAGRAHSGTIQKAMTAYWRAAATITRTWNSSWYPNTAGTGSGRRAA